MFVPVSVPVGALLRTGRGPFAITKIYHLKWQLDDEIFLLLTTKAQKSDLHRAFNVENSLPCLFEIQFFKL